ncbi:hypothetical protein [Paractinoplanes abujensis]|uniref:hypothetical protein n=1 Tax=Paractinoplanes abujensis TaxID=882441 RepID=UPI0034DAC6E2
MSRNSTRSRQDMKTCGNAIILRASRPAGESPAVSHVPDSRHHMGRLQAHPNG